MEKSGTEGKGPYCFSVRDRFREVGSAAGADGAGCHAAGQGGAAVDATRHGATSVEMLVYGHGQRLAVQELLLRRRELRRAARRARAPHPLAARHRGRGPVVLARHARERVPHREKKSPPRKKHQLVGGRPKGEIFVRNETAKMGSKRRPDEPTTKSRRETSMESCERRDLV
jgi:hypothetical protein